MAGVIGTNVTADGSAEYAFINAILNAIEQKQLEKGRTEEARMAKIIGDHIAKGGSGSYKLVPRKYAAQMGETLKKYDVPYTLVYNDAGDACFVTRDIDASKFTAAQKDVFSMSTEYYAQTDREQLAHVAKMNGWKEVKALEFQSEADFNEAQLKMFSNGVVCVTDAQNMKIYVSPADEYDPNGQDLVSFELDWAVNQSMNDPMFGGDPEQEAALMENPDAKNPDALDKCKSPFQRQRESQATHDIDTIREFISTIKEGKSSVMVDSENGSNTYLEYKKGTLSLMKKNDKGLWQAARTWDSKDLQELSDGALFGLLARASDDIHNTFVLNESDKGNVLDKTPQEAMSHCVWKFQENPSKTVRQNHSYVGRDAEVSNLKASDMKTLMGAVDVKARAWVESGAYPNIKDKRAAVKKAIQDILADIDAPPVNEFVNKPSAYMSKEDKIQWVSNISAHFANEDEKQSAHEVKVTEISVRELEEQARKEKQAEQEKDRQQTEQKTESQEKEADNEPLSLEE